MARCLVFLMVLLFATPSLAAGLATLLKLREGLRVDVREPKRGPFSGTLIRVSDDHFCIQFGERDTLTARCYPYTAIRAITPSDPSNPYYIIETL